MYDNVSNKPVLKRISTQKSVSFTYTAVSKAKNFACKLLLIINRLSPSALPLTGKIIWGWTE
jgi:hypothetical protein